MTFADDLPKPPATPIENVVDRLHGVELVDPYRWLEEAKSPRTRQWLDEQIAHTDSLLHKQPGIERIKARLGELMKLDVMGMPTVRGKRYFFSRRKKDQDQSIFVMREGVDGPETVLIDPNGWSKDNTTSVSALDISKDGTRIVYGVRQGGEDEQEIRVLDVTTGKDLPDRIPKGRYFGGAALTPDNRSLYYSRYETEGPRIYRHEMGTEVAKDTLLFGEKLPKGLLAAFTLSDDGARLAFTVIHGSAASKTEVYLQEPAGTGEIKPLVTDIQARFSAIFAGPHLYIETNWKAPNGRLLRVEPGKAKPDEWTEILAEDPKAPLQSVSPIGGKLYVNRLVNATSRMSLHEPDGALVSVLKLPGIGTSSGMSGEWDQTECFYSFSSFTDPGSIYRSDVKQGLTSLWFAPPVPFDGSKFQTEQVWYTSKDGTKVPMFLVSKKGMVRDGSNPVLLTGYGGFNISRTPSFSASTAVWLELGGVYALPNLRGGGEFGEAWHEAGMREKKQNVFDDFHAAAEWLIENKVTTPEKLSISGGSNGGLLVGAAFTQRPELFRAVVCSVPLLDMVRFDRFLVAKFWVPEYGSAETPGDFEFIRKYSPYHNVKPGTKYPAIMFVTGDADTRVDPLHARKMAALMQAATGSKHPVLLHYDLKAGHSQGLPVNKQIEDAADVLIFLCWQLGVPVK
jgi:prolyl oligopeptidase